MNGPHNLLDKYKNDMNSRYSKNISDAWQMKICLPYDLYPDVWTKRSRAMLPKSKPWILWISFVGPHEPFDIPNDWVRVSEKVKETKKPMRWKGSSKSHLRNHIHKWQNKLTTMEIEKIKLNYKRNCKLLDELTQEIVQEVEHSNFKLSTNYLITSDHGELLGDYGMLYKSVFLEEAIKVPLIYYTGNIDNEKEFQDESAKRKRNERVKRDYQQYLS